jgi:nucleoside-diphosphate-sugar epimerase
VTGGAGFIGSHIVDEMVKRGCETIVMDILSKNNLGNLERYRDHITLINGSITNEELVKDNVDVDVIFHEAAYNLGPSIQSPVDALMVNTKGTLNILQSLKAGLKDTVLIYGSTGSVYGKSLYSPQDENHPCNPMNPYAISKYAAERYVDFFAKQYGLKTVCLRYYNVVGRRQNIGNDGGLLSNFIIHVLKGEPPVVEGDGTQKRCFTSVEDVVEANVLAYEAEKAYGSTFNIAGAEVVTINELATLICSFSEKPLKPVHVKKRNGEEYDFEPSIDLARRVLGYSPNKRLIDVLPNLMEWIRGELGIKQRVRGIKQ